VGVFYEMIDYNKYFLNNVPKNSIVVEVGAAGPDFLSQSKPFRDIGWRSICIEPNPRFAQMHRDCGSEIIECACSDIDQDNVDFDIVTINNPLITNESFSSLRVTDEWASRFSESRNSLNINTIKVKVRKLDSILEELNISKIDCLFVDVEGYEINVMNGFSLHKYGPKIVVLENTSINDEEIYHNYMSSRGYIFEYKFEFNYLYVKQNENN
jgi:FkbM family methyltransferase